MKNASQKAQMDFQSHLRESVGGGIAPTLIRLPDLKPVEPVADDESPVWGASAANKAVEIATMQRSDLDREASFNSHSPLHTVSTFDSVNAPSAIANQFDSNFAAPIPTHSAPKPASAATASASRTHATKDASESFAAKTLAVIASRKTLLLLLALIAGWAIFAPRRSVDAKRDSDALIAKDPVATQVDPGVASIADSHATPPSTRPAVPANPAGAVAGLMTPVDEKAESENGFTPPSPASVAKETMNEASAITADASFTKEASLASISFQKDSLALWDEPHSQDLSSGLDVANFNPLPQPPMDSVPTTPVTAQRQTSVEPIGSQMPPSLEEPERIPAPTPTQTPDEITNWLDYLPPLQTASDELGMASDVSVRDRRSLNVSADFAGAVSELGVPAERDRTPATGSPNAPDFSDSLPGAGRDDESYLRSDFNSPSNGNRPDARVAMPGYAPEFNLRR